MLIEYLAANELEDYIAKPMTVAGTVMAMPFIQTTQAQQAAQLMAHRAGAEGVVLAIYDTQRIGFTQIVNLAFKATHSPYFGYVAQDAYAGRQWLQLALTALGDDTSKKSFLGFNDGKWAGALAAFGLAKRSWAQNNYAGHFFFPAYQRHYADAELTLLALQAGVYAYDPNSVLVEVDWEKDRSTVDPADRALFAQRKAGHFDGRVTAPTLLNWIA